MSKRRDKAEVGLGKGKYLRNRWGMVEEELMNARVGMEIEEFWTLFRLLLACFA